MENLRVRRGRYVPSALITATALALAGCGGSDDEGSSAGASSGGLKTVSVSTQPAYAFMAQFVARNQGYFRDNGLNVKSVSVPNSAAAQAALAAGQLEFTYCGHAPVFAAIAGGVKARLVAPANGLSDGISELLVKADGPIRSAQDFRGKTVGVNSPKGQEELNLRAWLEQNGVPQDSVKIAAVPFPDQATAVERGRVDAAPVLQPFLTPAKASGDFRSLGDPSLAVGPHDVTAHGSYCTSEELISEDPETVKGFSDAIVKANRFVRDNPKDPGVIKALAQATGVTEADAAKSTIGPLPPSYDLANVQKQIDLANRFDLVDKELKTDEIVWSGAPKGDGS